MSSEPDCKDLVRPGLVAHKHELPEVKKKLRARLPLTTARALRRARLPFYLALHEELTEDGYFETDEFLRHLVDLENDLHASATEGLKLKRLYEERDRLLELIECMQKTEEMNHGEILNNVKDLMRIGNAFAHGISDYQWVAEDVLLKTLSEARRILTDNYMTALALYYLGQLYFRNKYYEQANEYFSEAVLLSENQKWTVSKTVNKILYDVACSEYCGSINELSKLVLQTDPNKSRLLCEKALVLAKNSNDFGVIAQAYTVLGQIQMKMERFEEAIDSLTNSVRNRRSENNLPMLCRSELDLAECRFIMNEFVESLRHCKRAFKIAESKNYAMELADSYAMMARTERMLGTNNLGADSFQKAVELYNALNEPEKMRSARCWAAISIAQGIIDPFTETVLKSDNQKLGGNPYMAKLLDWKLTRTPFWVKNDEGEKMVSAMEILEDVEL